MGGPRNPDGERELVLRELERQRIRVALLAEEIARRRKWEDEVGAELMRKRELARRRKWEDKVGMELMRERELALRRFLKSPATQSDRSPGDLGTRRRSASPLSDVDFGSRFPETPQFQRKYFMTATATTTRVSSPDTGTTSAGGKEIIMLVNPDQSTGHCSLTPKALAGPEAEADLKVRNISLYKKTGEGWGESTSEQGLSKTLQGEKHETNQDVLSALKIDFGSAAVYKNKSPVNDRTDAVDEELGGTTSSTPRNCRNEKSTSDDISNTNDKAALVADHENRNGSKGKLGLALNGVATGSTSSHSNKNLVKPSKTAASCIRRAEIAEKERDDDVQQGNKRMKKEIVGQELGGGNQTLCGVPLTSGSPLEATVLDVNLGDRETAISNQAVKGEQHGLSENLQLVTTKAGLSDQKIGFGSSGVSNKTSPVNNWTEPVVDELGGNTAAPENCGKSVEILSDMGTEKIAGVLEEKHNGMSSSQGKNGLALNGRNFSSTSHSNMSLQTPLQADGKKGFKYRCEVCGVKSISEKTMSRHYSGKNHFRKLKKALESNKAEPTSGSTAAAAGASYKRSLTNTNDEQRETKRMKKETAGEGKWEDQTLRKSMTTTTWINHNDGTFSAAKKGTTVLIKPDVGASRTSQAHPSAQKVDFDSAVDLPFIHSRNVEIPPNALVRSHTEDDNPLNAAAVREGGAVGNKLDEGSSHKNFRFRFWCQMCQVGTESAGDINRHLGGKEHLAKLLRLESGKGKCSSAPRKCYVWRRESGKEVDGLQSESK